MNVLGRVSVWILLCLAACSVDDRELSLASGAGGGGSGGSSGQSAGRGGSEPNGTGAEAGSDGAPDGLVDGCADLDTDGIADCTTTLVKTPSFTEDVEGWAALEEAELTWDAKNALTDEPSGSAKLSAVTPRASALQCLPLSGRQLVIAYAQVMAEPVEDEDAARGQLHVAFFESKDCTGEPIGFFETPPSTEAGTWTTVQAGGLSDEDAASLAVSLVGVKPSAAKRVEVYFDNVMLKSQNPD